MMVYAKKACWEDYTLEEIVLLFLSYFDAIVRDERQTLKHQGLV